MEWYKINEISFKDYVDCLKPIYDILEKKNKPNGEDDPFLKTVLKEYYEFSETQWNDIESEHRFRKVLTMKMGDFHEELAGKFIGYQTLNVGDSTGCDVINKDNCEVWEWKNRENTMNADSLKTVKQKLERNYSEGKKVFLVIVNCKNQNKPKRFNLPEHITVYSGKQAYTYLSGRESFYEDLMKTIKYTFNVFKSHSELQAEMI